MDWFKHDTSATQDAKLKKLLIHSEKMTGNGAIGYAIYFHCLELIAGDINSQNITFQLEHDAEIIADNLRIRGTSQQSGTEIVEAIMKFIVGIGLFEESDNRIFCTKLLKRIDGSMTGNPKFRAIISKAKEYHDTVMTESCKIRSDKIRSDKTREEESVQEPTPQTDTEAPQSTELVSSAPTALAPKKLAPMKDDYAQAWQDALTARQPDSTWSNYGKERKALVTLGQRTRQLMEQTPYQNAGELIESVIRTFSDIRQTAKDGYWKNAPMTPSAVLTRWAEIWAKLSTRTAHQDDPHMQAVWAEILSDMEGNL